MSIKSTLGWIAAATAVVTLIVSMPTRKQSTTEELLPNGDKEITGMIRMSDGQVLKTTAIKSPGGKYKSGSTVSLGAQGERYKIWDRDGAMEVVVRKDGSMEVTAMSPEINRTKAYKKIVDLYLGRISAGQPCGLGGSE